MKKASLKRMLEEAELSNSSKISAHKPIGVVSYMDLYSLPGDIDSKTAEDIVEAHTEDVFEIKSSSDIILQSQRLQAAIDANSKAREVYADTPLDFAVSEVSLVDVIKTFHVVALLPDLYSVLVSCGVHVKLINLLDHANEDVGLEVLSLISELTDETVLDCTSVENLCVAFVESGFYSAVYRVLTRVLSSEDGVSVGLQVLSNFVDILPESFPINDDWISLFSEVFSTSWTFVQSQCAEILLFQSVPLVSSSLFVCVTGLLQKLVQLPAPSVVELELIAHLSDVVYVMLTTSPGLKRTVPTSDTIPTIVQMMRSRDLSNHGLRLANVCCLNDEAISNEFVNLFGLKPLGALLVKDNTNEHAVSIANTLLSVCTDEQLNRVICKFVENDFQKTHAAIGTIEKILPLIRQESNSEMTPEDVFLEKCKLGLFTLQQAALIVLRLFAIPSIRPRILAELKSLPMQEFLTTIHEYIELLHTEKSAHEIEHLRNLLVQLQTDTL